MDHSNAYLMELKNGAIVTETVKSEFAPLTTKSFPNKLNKSRAVPL